MILTGCKLCHEEIWGSSTSPDGKWTATIIMRDCGATTDEVVSLNVHRAGDTEYKAENNAIVINHGYAPGPLWQGTDILLVACQGCTRKDVISTAAQVGPIRIVNQIR